MKKSFKGFEKQLPNDTERSFLVHLEYKQPSSFIEWPVYWLRLLLPCHLKIYESEVDELKVRDNSNGSFYVSLGFGRSFDGLSNIDWVDDIKRFIESK